MKKDIKVQLYKNGELLKEISQDDFLADCKKGIINYNSNAEQELIYHIDCIKKEVYKLFKIKIIADWINKLIKQHNN